MVFDFNGGYKTLNFLLQICKEHIRVQKSKERKTSAHDIFENTNTVFVYSIIMIIIGLMAAANDGLQKRMSYLNSFSRIMHKQNFLYHQRIFKNKQNVCTDYI